MQMMEPSFSDREKRFVLAEIIKNSGIDADAIASFVRARHVEPDWMSMQLPLGRNMYQCMEAAHRMSIGTPSLKRKPWEESYTQHPSKRLAISERTEQSYYHGEPIGTSMTTQHHVPILPRPSSANASQPQQSPLPQEGPKKRGRPSRADKAKRDLRPILPQPPIVPRSASNGASPDPPPSRPALPSLLPVSPSAARPMTPPEAYIPTKRSPSSPRDRRRSAASSIEEQPKTESSCTKATSASAPASSLKRSPAD